MSFGLTELIIIFIIFFLIHLVGKQAQRFNRRYRIWFIAAFMLSPFLAAPLLLLIHAINPVNEEEVITK
jgi:succinate dehydrogenase hydrophobic anchor subunit